ncbi:hypothetical protein H0H92_001062 [Tricholoma furcatifolium]|nr:hypothetical protein H0H92_001062 [Tricholoma furcatifolium]
MSSSLRLASRSHFLHRPLLARLASTNAKRLPSAPKSQTQAQGQAQQPPAQPTSWLTRKVKASPAAMKFFLNLTNVMGYGSTKQVAGRRAFALYERVVAVTPDTDAAFWQQNCRLPPTFQSWFTVTNLHIWMLTVRLRALPGDEGKHYTQALIDHFFIDIEDRIRAVLQPQATPSKPYTFHTPFYVNPNAPAPGDPTDAKGRPRPRSRAPDRLVTRQMKIFKEQWAGLGLSMDLGLVKGDMDMAAAVWRNLLGARGAQGIAFPDPGANANVDAEAEAEATNAKTQPKKFRRSVNLVGGEVVNVAKIDLEKEEARDDGSGVHDFAPEEADLYLEYPQLMLDVVGYVRRELVRLEKLSDEQIRSGALEGIRFGRVRQ